MRHRPSHRRRNTTLGVLASIVALILLIVWCILRPLPPVRTAQTLPATHTPAATPLAWPSGGGSAIEVQGVTHHMEHGDQQPVPISSLAKLITALTVLQKYPLKVGELGPTMTLNPPDVDLYNFYGADAGTTVRVAPGEQLTEFQAMEAMLVPSANNAADSLAIWAFGSLPEYQTAATLYVRQLGMSNTTIGPDASGMSPKTTSTPADMMRLAEQVAASPALTKILTITEAELPDAGHVDGVGAALPGSGLTGFRTNKKDPSDGSFLFTGNAEPLPGKPVTIVGVILGQHSGENAARAAPLLVESVKANLSVSTPVHGGDAVAKFSTAWGAHATAIARRTITLLAWNGETITPELTLQRAGISYENGAVIGNVSARSGLSSGTSEVTMTGNLSDPTLLWRLLRR